MSPKESSLPAMYCRLAMWICAWIPFATGEVCKGIARLVANESLDNFYGGRLGWYGQGEDGRGQFVASPFADEASDYSMRDGACIPNYKNVECHQGKDKGNCNEAQTCSQLLEIKSKLLAGGYNCFGRHERTYWQQQYGEKACRDAANCASASASPGAGQPTGPFNTPSRFLSPWGWKGSKIASEAFKAMGLADNVDTFASSPMPRCEQNLAHWAPGGLEALDNVTGEKLFYLGSLLENVQRKGFCASGELDQRGAFMYLYDVHRKLAGTPPAAGKNNIYMSHGFNLQGAFGEYVDEGYWMCLKPNSAQYPRTRGSYVVDHHVCADGPQPSVDFSSVFQFETDFLLSSESFHLMNACGSMENAVGGIFELDTAEPRLQLTQAEVGSATAFAKLLEIQSHALDFVPNPREAVDRGVFHLGLFVHNNGGYRYPESVHVPLRRIIEDTIGGGSQRATFAIATAIIDAGDMVDYASCPSETPAFNHIKKCYKETQYTAADWYWGGENTARTNVNHGFESSSVYGDLQYQGSPSWFTDEYESGYIQAGACLVEKGRVSLAGLLADMGCGPDPDCAGDYDNSFAPTRLSVGVLIVLFAAAIV